MDRPLSSDATSQFKAGDRIVNRRFIPVPCDLEPGAYDVLIGLYDPETLEALPVALPDGAPLGSLAYITTVQVVAAP